MPSKKYRVRITEDKLNPSDATHFASSERHGAAVVFHGVTRDHTNSRKVILLEYEAYVPMAKKKLEEIAKEMCSNWDILVAIDHRLGKVDIGEESLVVAVGSPHRQSAFEAASYSVDRIKQTVPIWKKEHFEGGEVWIGDADGIKPLEHKSG